MQRQQRNNDLVDQRADNSPKFNAGFTQHTPGHQRQANADYERQQQRRHDPKDRGHFHFKIRLEAAGVGLTHIRSQRLGDNVRKNADAHHVGKET